MEAAAAAAAAGRNQLRHARLGRQSAAATACATEADGNRTQTARRSTYRPLRVVPLPRVGGMCRA
jgi:hypothetical protein